MGCINSRDGNGAALTLQAATVALFEQRQSKDDAARRRQLPQSRALGTESQPSFHDRFVLLQKLGCGAFASVHSACSAAGGRGRTELAVKITDLRAQRSKGVFGRFVDTRRCQEVWGEVEMLQKVQGSAHTIGFYDAFMEGGLSYVVMEKCDSPLLQVLDRLPWLNEGSLSPILRDMLSGIAAIHRVRVVHRDVKPDNFLCVGSPHTVKLCDFGFASVVASDSVEDGLKGVFGTPPFMAPEILKGSYYSMPVDVWAFGVIVYCLLFGEFPYMPAEHTGAAMKVAIKDGVPAPSFRVAGALRVATRGGSLGWAPSVGAMSLVRMLLQRQAEQRPSARTALTTDFFVSLRHSNGRTEDTLRPQLRVAKRIGVFDVCCGLGHGDSDVDRRLSYLQTQKHGDALMRKVKSLGARAADRRPTLLEDAKLKKDSFKHRAPSFDLESCASTYASGDSAQ